MKFLIPSFLSVFVLFCVIPCHAEGITVVSNSLPPFKFEKDGKIQGIMADVLVDILGESGCTFDSDSIQTSAWARAYDTTLHDPGTIIISLAMTEERKPLFKWVGPVTSITLGLIGKKNRGFDIQRVQDATQYKVGTLRGTAPEQLLFKQGFPLEEADRISKTHLALKMLDDERIDLFAHTADSSFFMMPGLGLNPSDYEVCFVIKKVDLYFGLNKEFEDEFVDKLQLALERMKHPDLSGVSRYDRIVSKYIH